MMEIQKELFNMVGWSVEEDAKYSRLAYPDSEICIKADFLGFLVDGYLYRDMHMARNIDTIQRAMSQMLTEERNHEGKKIVGRVVTAVNGVIFDKDPIFLGDLFLGMEYVVAEVLANFIEFGIKNYLFMTTREGVILEEEDFFEVDETVDESQWIVMESYKTKFLLHKEGIKGLSIPKINTYYKSLEKIAREEGGIGMRLVNMDGASFDDFKNMMGL